MAAPHAAMVTVYWINDRCVVRALHLPTGERVATVIDTDPTNLLVPVLSSWSSGALAPDGQGNEAGLPWAVDGDPLRQLQDVLQRSRVFLPALA